MAAWPHDNGLRDRAVAASSIGGARQRAGYSDGQQVEHAQQRLPGLEGRPYDSQRQLSGVPQGKIQPIHWRASGRLGSG